MGSVTCFHFQRTDSPIRDSFLKWKLSLEILRLVAPDCVATSSIVSSLAGSLHHGFYRLEGPPSQDNRFVKHWDGRIHLQRDRNKDYTANTNGMMSFIMFMCILLM